MKMWLKITLWSLFGITIIALGIKIKTDLNAQLLVAPKIVIHVDDENAFISENELLERLKRNNFVFEGQKREELDIESIEQFIGSISQVKSVDVFQQINGEWQIDLYIRKPIARVFNKFGESFYLDSEGNTMLTTPSHTARTLVFTGEIKDKPNSISVTDIINNDSLISIRKLDDIYRISDYVCNDPLFHSMVGQIHLEKNGDFILVPLVGDQKIIFGTAHSNQEVESKFEKLKIFYTEAIAYEGWTKYAEISLKYEDQIVCKKKNTNE
jgi:cell division protein FtsQ